MAINDSKSVGNIVIISITITLALLVGLGLAGLVYADDGRDLDLARGFPELSRKLDTITQTSIPTVGDKVDVATSTSEAVLQLLQDGLLAIGDEFAAMNAKIDDISSMIRYPRAKWWISPHLSTERHFDPIFDNNHGHADITHIYIHNPNPPSVGTAEVSMVFHRHDMGNYYTVAFEVGSRETKHMEFHEKTEGWNLGNTHGSVIIHASLPVMPHGHVTSIPYKPQSGGPEVYHANIGYTMTWYPDLIEPMYP